MYFGTAEKDEVVMFLIRGCFLGLGLLNIRAHSDQYNIVHREHLNACCDSISWLEPSIPRDERKMKPKNKQHGENSFNIEHSWRPCRYIAFTELSKEVVKE